MSKDRYIRATFSPESTRVPQRIRDFYAGDDAPADYTLYKEDEHLNATFESCFKRTRADFEARRSCDREMIPMRFLYGVNLMAIHQMVMQEIGMQLEELRRLDEQMGSTFADSFSTPYLEQIVRELWASGFLVPQDVELLRNTEEEMEFDDGRPEVS